jgi:exonuclease SbcC
VGGVGCGKSSVLYAIDFAIFGDPVGKSYEYLLREGADSCKVALQFAHSGKTYTITRGLRKRGKGVSQDWEQLKLTQNDTLLASVKSEAVAEQLKAITGLDKDLFREIVWVRQEQLKQLLDMTPRERQKRLDELFGLSDFEVSWTNMVGVEKEFKVEKGVYERDPDVVGMGKLHQDYDKTVEEFASVEEQIASSKKRLFQAEIALNEANVRLSSLEELRKKTEELRRKETELETNIANFEDACARLAEDIDDKKTMIQTITQRLQTLENEENFLRAKLQETGSKPDQGIEELRKNLQAFEEQIRSIVGEQEAARKEMRETQRRLSELTAQNTCPLCLQNLAADYKIGLLDRLRKDNVEQENRLAELQKDKDELERLQNIVNHALLSLQMLAPKMEELRNRASEERRSVDRLSREFEEKQNQEKALREQLSSVRTEIAKFDLAQLESARRIRDEAFQVLHAAKSDLESTEKDKRNLNVRLDDLKQRLDNAQKKIDRMKKIESALEIVGVVRDAYRNIQPRLRSEFVNYLQRVIQQMLDDLVGGVGPSLFVQIDEAYSPTVKGEENFERDVSNLSGGERTLLAFAYRLGLGQLITQLRTGHGLSMLLLDEPTESLGREDGSIDRLAEAISRLKAIEQIIAVTHSEAFAEKAEHVIRVDKEAGASRVTIEK